MTKNTEPKAPKPPKLTDTERHKRFVDMAKEVEASEDPEAFEKAFNAVAHPPAPAEGGGDGN